MERDEVGEVRETGPLRQGDIVQIAPGLAGESVGVASALCAVALLSQTCDIVQSTKNFCLVAPVEESDDRQFADALKGRRPLAIPLEDDSGRRWIADLERAFSVPKSSIETGVLVSRCADSDYGQRANMVRARVARAYGRFPFPDEVHPIFKKLRGHLQSKAGSSGNLGRVIDLVEEFRVAADQWGGPQRRLKLFVIVPSDQLIPSEDADTSWTWMRVREWSSSDSEASLTLDRTCELLLANQGGDATSTLNLWRVFGQRLYSQLIQPCLNDEVREVDVEVVSDEDFTLQQFKRSESLDLEALSDSYTETEGTSAWINESKERR